MSQEQDELIADWQTAFEAQLENVDHFSRISQVERVYKVIYFISMSAGRFRRRPPREITLLRDRITGRAKAVGDTPKNGLDTLAQDLFEGTIPEGEDAFNLLLNTVSAIIRKRYSHKN